MSSQVLSNVRFGDLVARAIRILNAAGVMDFNGHVSARDDDDPNKIWINNRIASRSTLTAADVVPYDLAAAKRIGDGQEPPSETFIHREIYLRRPDVRGIVHSHPKAILKLSAAGQRLQPIAAIGTFLPEEGAAAFDSAVLINTQRRGEAMAQSLGHGPLVVLRQHGAVAVGGSVEEAVIRMICAEDNADIQLSALRAGTPNYLRGEELAVIRDENWGAHATRKYWLYQEETARRAGALRGLDDPAE
jgi:ribulose-5-phosphate 4-epimerase/fuculose-1-phosphate aldolase